MEEKSVLNSIEFIDSAMVVDNLILPSRADSVEILWDNSSHPQILSNLGKVTRPCLSQGDTVVTLEASCIVDNRTFVKVFEFTVVAKGLKREDITILGNSFTMLQVLHGELKKPGGRINITKSYYISEFAVERSLFDRVVKGDELSARQNIPATNISWDEANYFCRKLSVYTGLEFRLPTEMELEYLSLSEGGSIDDIYLWSSDRFSDPIVTGENPAIPASTGDYITIVKEGARDYQPSLEGGDQLGFRLAFDN